jgi:hypothetical protein
MGSISSPSHEMERQIEEQIEEGIDRQVLGFDSGSPVHTEEGHVSSSAREVEILNALIKKNHRKQPV